MKVVPVRRLGLIGDIHAEDGALEDALRALQRLEVDAIAATGDIVDGVGSVDRCCALLKTHNALVVAGNHERWLLGDYMREIPDAHRLPDLAPATVAWLGALPRVIRIATVAGLAMLCHGLGENDMARVLPGDEGSALRDNFELQQLLANDDARFVLNGHSHRRLVRRFERLTLVNAGTLKHDHDPSFVMIDFDRQRVSTFEPAPGEAVRLLDEQAL